MTPEEIAQKVVDEWWEISGTLRGTIASAIRAEREKAEKADAALIAYRDDAVRNLHRATAAEAERDRLRAERDSLMMRVNHGTPKDACYSTDDDPNCPLEHLWITRNGDLRAERDRLREALLVAKTDMQIYWPRSCENDVRERAIRRIDVELDPLHEALARAKGESNG